MKLRPRCPWVGVFLTVSNLIEGLGLMEMIPEVGEGMIFNSWMGRAIENRINCLPVGVEDKIYTQCMIGEGGSRRPEAVEELPTN